VCVSRRFEIDSTSNAPALARRYARTELAALLVGGSELAEAVGDVELLVSELVSNAVKASAAPVLVGLEVHHKWLGLMVHDDDPADPVVMPPDPAQTHGRGLRIVSILAEAWGVRRDPAGGKTVWLRLRLPVATTDHLLCDSPADPDWTAD
jgi:Histidine kinase-like ATPase domain